MNIETQIAGIISVANDQWVYCNTILKYPKKYNKNYNPSSGVDNFWMNVCKVFFYDSLSLTANLLSRDARTISFFNWQEFVDSNNLWLENQISDFEESGLKSMRDQITSHLDISNCSNNIPIFRRRGIINEGLVLSLGNTQKEFINKFNEFTVSNNRPYNRNNYFGGKEAQNEIEFALKKNPPELTENPVI